MLRLLLKKCHVSEDALASLVADTPAMSVAEAWGNTAAYGLFQQKGLCLVESFFQESRFRLA